MGARKFEAMATADWSAHGTCNTCQQKITSSPKDCKSRDHKS